MFKRKQEEQLIRNELHLLKREDRKEELSHIMEMQEYTKEKILDRLEDKNERVKRLEQERIATIEMKEKIKRQMQKEKEKVLAEFERNKKKNLKVIAYTR